jgi:ribosome-associated protein
VRGLSGVTDYYLIATGTSSPHIKALADELHRALRQDRIHCFRRSGGPESGWMVADYVDAVVHILTPEARDYYGLEDLWSDGQTIE